MSYLIMAGNFAHGLLFYSPLAHGGAGAVFDPDELWRQWEFEPVAFAMMAVSMWLYARGLERYWKGGNVGRGILRAEAASYFLGWATLFVALFSPIHTAGEVLFSAHMTQHEILMLVSAPLLVMGRPVIASLRGMPVSTAARLARLSNRPVLKETGQILMHPFVAWLLHAAALWLWHIPAWFEATLDSTLIHSLQHASFFGTACLFWWATICAGPRAIGAAVLYQFTTALHSGLLGALLTFTGRHWYPRYEISAELVGVAPMDDQQLGGLIMWIPAGMVYVIAGLLLVAGWMRHAEARALARALPGPVTRALEVRA